MKKFIISIMMLMIVTSCRTTHSIQTVTAVTHDTLRQSNIRYDSIYLDNTVYVDRSGDTVFIRENHVQYKYKFIRDTVYYHQTDTVRASSSKVQVSSPKIPPWCKWLTITGVLATIILIILFYKKVATFL